MGSACPETARPHTPRKTVALATETDPSCASGAAGGFPTSEAGLLVLAFPGGGGGGAPSTEPEIHCSLLLGHQCPAGRVGEELKPHWGIWQGGGHLDDPQVPAKPHAWGSLAPVPGSDTEQGTLREAILA